MFLLYYFLVHEKANYITFLIKVRKRYIKDQSVSRDDLSYEVSNVLVTTDSCVCQKALLVPEGMPPEAVMRPARGETGC